MSKKHSPKQNTINIKDIEFGVTLLGGTCFYGISEEHNKVINVIINKPTKTGGYRELGKLGLSDNHINSTTGMCEEHINEGINELVTKRIDYLMKGKK